MTVKERITIRLTNNVRQKLDEKCPDANKSLMINNVFDYLLAQKDDLILEFTKKRS